MSWEENEEYANRIFSLLTGGIRINRKPTEQDREAAKALQEAFTSDDLVTALVSNAVDGCATALRNDPATAAISISDNDVNEAKSSLRDQAKSALVATCTLEVVFQPTLENFKTEWPSSSGYARKNLLENMLNVCVGLAAATMPSSSNASTSSNTVSVSSSSSSSVSSSSSHAASNTSISASSSSSS